MALNRDDPVHVALIALAISAASLVDDLHDYQHWLGAEESELYTLRQIERHYEEVTVAWSRFQEALSGSGHERLPAPGDP